MASASSLCIPRRVGARYLPDRRISVPEDTSSSAPKSSLPGKFANLVSTESGDARRVIPQTMYIFSCNR